MLSKKLVMCQYGDYCYNQYDSEWLLQTSFLLI